MSETIVDEPVLQRGLCLSDRLYDKLKARARRLSRERGGAHVSFSGALAELLEMTDEPGWEWPRPAIAAPPVDLAA